MERVIAPEILDRLPADDPAARDSRADLRRINGLMGNGAWLRRQLRRHVGPGERVLEIGAGDGSLQLHRHVGLHDGLDLLPPPADWPENRRWFQQDIAQFNRWSDYAVICGNLVFHHFPASLLEHLGARIRAHARVFLACEPLRSPLFHFVFPGICAALRAHPVTRHDGRVSIHAGFRGGELAHRLGLASGWHCRVTTTWRGAYRLVAVRS